MTHGAERLDDSSDGFVCPWIDRRVNVLHDSHFACTDYGLVFSFRVCWSELATEQVDPHIFLYRVNFESFDVCDFDRTIGFFGYVECAFFFQTHLIDFVTVQILLETGRNSDFYRIRRTGFCNHDHGRITFQCVGGARSKPLQIDDCALF